MIRLSEFKRMVAALEAPEGEDPVVLVEVFDEEGENHLAALQPSLDFETRCADDHALFLWGDVVADASDGALAEEYQEP